MDKKRKEMVSMVEQEMSLFVRNANSQAISTKILDRSAYLLLGSLEKNGSQSTSSLAEGFQLDISTASRQIAALEKKELVRRVPDPGDRRVNLIEITSHGKERLNTVRQMRFARYEQFLEDWSVEDCRRFGEYMNRLNRSMQQWARED